ncbi:hypothetical protein [Streptosporangium sandarakinum]|uniref:hypothetical protein n=1 Tax=Streptosporangium sandarakinum TaxID=1260955 RepID=UPI0037A1A0D2
MALSKTPVLTGTVISREQRQLAALEQTFPGWRITHDALLDQWTAIRHAPLTRQEENEINRSSPEALASALAVQVELAHRLRARHHFTS